MIPPPHIAEVIRKIKSKTYKVARARELLAGVLNVGFVAACQSDQTAADTEVDGQACGAFTAYFLKTANYYPKDTNLTQLVEYTRTALRDNGYAQIPQSAGPRATLPLLY
jgi:hypothetical protein